MVESDVDRAAPRRVLDDLADADTAVRLQERQLGPLDAGVVLHQGDLLDLLVIEGQDLESVGRHLRQQADDEVLAIVRVDRTVLVVVLHDLRQGFLPDVGDPGARRRVADRKKNIRLLARRSVEQLRQESHRRRRVGHGHQAGLHFEDKQ